MVCKNKLAKIICLLLIFLTFNSFSQKNSNPQFSDYQVDVSQGPFERKPKFNYEQEGYSMRWKKTMQDQLSKPVNFAGHFRIYTEFGGYGKECLRDNWVCGWVIDKHTGKVVASLPTDDSGSNIYADVSDNGTPVGLPFEVDAYNNSSMIAVTGQAIPIRENDSPVCKTTLFNFEKNYYIKLIESLDGCKT